MFKNEKGRGAFAPVNFHSFSSFLPLIQRLLRENLQENRSKYIRAVFCMLIVAASTSGLVLVTHEIVNEVFLSRNQSAVLGVAFLVIFLSLLKGAATYYQELLMTKVEKTIAASLQERQFKKIIHLGLRHFSEKRPAKIMAKINHSARASGDVILTISTECMRNIFVLIGLLIVMFTQDPKMSLFALIGLPFIFTSLSKIGVKIKKLALHERDLFGQVITEATEALTGIREVKSFGLEKEFSSKVSHSIHTMENHSNRLVGLQALASPVMEVVGGVIIVIFLSYASWQSIEHGRNPGEFVAFVAAFLSAYEPAKKLARVNVELKRKMVAVQQMYDLLDDEGAENISESGRELNVSEGKVVFDNVSFNYGHNMPTLTNVSFTAQKGEIVALVGRSGSGKTSITSLLMRFYDDFEGRITIDGVEIRDVSLPSLRRQMGVSGQNSFLFNTTIRENIQMGNRKAVEKDVIAAAKAAQADHFISTLPDGYDTVVGENGSKLSGGERQKIAIARAFIKNAPILMMDEAISSLDGDPERLLLEDLTAITAERTCLVIAHRLSTIMKADRIILLDAGRVVGNGTHKQLLASNAIYKMLFQSSIRQKQEQV